MATTAQTITALVDRANALAPTASADAVFYAAKTLETIGETSTAAEAIASVVAARDAALASVAAGARPAIARTLKTEQESFTVGTTDTAFGTGLSATITPRYDGSHFKITVRAFGEADEAWNIVCNITRNNSRINQGLNAQQAWHGLSMHAQSYGGGENNNSTPEMINFCTLDTTGSTAGAAITFALVVSANAAKTGWINRCFTAPQSGYETGTSEIIIEEIPQ